INIFTIAVTAEDGITTLNYKVTVTRDYNNDATLSELALSEGTLDAEFNSTHYVYTTDVVEGMEEVTLTAVPTDTNATVTGAGLITISSGTNVLVVTVTAQDKVTESNYIIVVNRTVGIDEPTQTDAKLVVYPNPTTGKLTIKCAETLHATSVQMFNVVGQVVGTWHTAPENTETTIDVSHLAKGMYFLKVDGEMFKVVKE
ncbi:MAG: T9SS type A sorting domain-containing protein, partial [Lentimicrobiaceae bacterium]|nr:T9SS type A sorting domain-containing protein [Lentimicrobiaceae bacterium]